MASLQGQIDIDAPERPGPPRSGNHAIDLTGRSPGQPLALMPEVPGLLKSHLNLRWCRHCFLLGRIVTFTAMWCPCCRYEFRPEIGRCPECEVELVRQLEEDPGEQGAMPGQLSDLVTVVEANDPMEAVVVRSVLEGAGIPVSVDAHFKLGRTQVQVPSEYADVAAQLLESEE